MMQISRTVSCLILTVILVLGAATLSSAVPPPNPMHPSFQLLGCPGQNHPAGRD